MRREKPPSEHSLPLWGRWSTLAHKFFNNWLTDQTVLGLYMFHISNRIAIIDTRDVGPKTLEEIRIGLIKRGLPDLAEPVFRGNYLATPGTRKCLRALLDSWWNASAKERMTFKRQLEAHREKG